MAPSRTVPGLSVATATVPGMAKGTPRDRNDFRCAECGWTAPKWVGRCGECQAWGTVEQVGLPRGAASVAAVVPQSSVARPIVHVDVEAARARPTGVGELDRVLGGGLVPGGVVLLAGEPGVGKSTLLLEVAARNAGPSSRTLYVTGEESAAQVRLRAGRIGALDPHLFLAAENDLATILGQVEAVEPTLVVLDSVQTVASADVDGSAGGVTQVKAVTAALVRVAKERNISMLLVGHVTKDGSIAGPRVLEHLVDVVLSFEGERHSQLRMVRAVKNRYGAVDEVGCFELHDAGITGLVDPSGLFLSRHLHPVSGTCITVTMEGRRPLVAEVQALVTPSQAPAPRRATSGLDAQRVAMVLAVLERRGRIPFSRSEVYAATVGGVKIADPGADLALALALAGAAHDRALPPQVVAIGEVGLAGEVRHVSGIGRRLAEAARLGFDLALVPRESGVAPEGLHLAEVSHVGQALELFERIVTG